MFAQQRGKRALVQFRAGKMIRDGKMVVPETRKGIFSLFQEPSGLVELSWKSEKDEETTLIMPGEAAFNKIEKCTTGRVFILDFKGTREMFFWLQEPIDGRDEEYIKKVKSAIGDRTTKYEAPKTADDAAAKPATAEAQRGGQNIDISTLQNILSNLGQGGGAAGQSREDLDLRDMLLSPEMLEAIKEDPAFFMSRLHEHLPSGTEPDADVVDELRNPQISSAAALLQAALSEPDGFQEVSNAFGVQGARGIGALEFLNMIMKQNQQK